MILLRMSLLVAAGLSSLSVAARDFPSEHGIVRVTKVTEGLQHPWGLAFLPDGRMLVTERPGRLRIVATDGSLSAPVTGVLPVAARGQGGLLDVALHPRFAENGWVYLSFAEAGEGDTAGTAVMRGRLEGDALVDTQVIFRQEPKVAGMHHFGSRLAFAADGKLFVSSGDRLALDNVQHLGRGQGKIFRLNDDGTPAPGNALATQPDAQAAIWSYGHRNVQGMTVDARGQLWATEHGPRGGDELNRVQGGRNYGWPVITFGVNYNGTEVGDGRSARPGMEQPVVHWTPSIAPSGLAFYNHSRFPAWRGQLFGGALAHQHVVRLQLANGRVVAQEKLLEGWGQRIRDVRAGPDGYLYLLTDAANGQLARVELVPR